MTSVPMVPTNRPNSVIATPLSGEPRDMVAPASRPSSMMALISVGPNLKATTSSTGDRKIMIRMPTEAAKNDDIIVTPSAAPPTQGQRQTLGPLERDWPTMDVPNKQKWLTIAARFHTLSPQEQARISERMSEWSRMTPLERGEVRMRFQEARQVPAPDRSARWEAYQKLSPAEKQRLLARANAAGPGASGVKRPSPPRDNQAKANVVPNPALAQPPRPVSPTMVQASPGATTRLITKLTMPPAHQQTGMPKIAATPEFVNRSTLLPRRGPQAASGLPMLSPARVSGTSILHPAPPRPQVLPALAPAASAPAASMPAR